MKRLFDWFKPRRSSGKFETPQKPVEKRNGKANSAETQRRGIRDLFGDDGDIGYC